MKRIPTIGLAAVATAAVAVTPAVTIAATKAKTKTVSGRCHLVLKRTSGTVLKGVESGTAVCAKLGAGTSTTTYTNTLLQKNTVLTSQGVGTTTLKNGSVTGTSSITGPFVAKGTSHLKGTFTITKGTGAYKTATGVQKITCVTSDLGVHLTCDLTGKIAHVKA